MISDFDDKRGIGEMLNCNGLDQPFATNKLVMTFEKLMLYKIGHKIPFRSRCSGYMMISDFGDNDGTSEMLNVNGSDRALQKNNLVTTFEFHRLYISYNELSLVLCLTILKSCVFNAMLMIGTVDFVLLIDYIIVVKYWVDRFWKRPRSVRK